MEPDPNAEHVTSAVLPVTSMADIEMSSDIDMAGEMDLTAGVDFNSTLDVNHLLGIGTSSAATELTSANPDEAMFGSVSSTTGLMDDSMDMVDMSCSQISETSSDVQGIVAMKTDSCDVTPIMSTRSSTFSLQDNTNDLFPVDFPCGLSTDDSNTMEMIATKDDSVVDEATTGEAAGEEAEQNKAGEMSQDKELHETEALAMEKSNGELQRQTLSPAEGSDACCEVTNPLDLTDGKNAKRETDVQVTGDFDKVIGTKDSESAGLIDAQRKDNGSEVTASTVGHLSTVTDEMVPKVVLRKRKQVAATGQRRSSRLRQDNTDEPSHPPSVLKEVVEPEAAKPIEGDHISDDVPAQWCAVSGDTTPLREDPVTKNNSSGDALAENVPTPEKSVEGTAGLEVFEDSVVVSSLPKTSRNVARRGRPRKRGRPSSARGAKRQCTVIEGLEGQMSKESSPAAPMLNKEQNLTVDGTGESSDNVGTANISINMPACGESVGSGVNTSGESQAVLDTNLFAEANAIPDKLDMTVENPAESQQAPREYGVTSTAEDVIRVSREKKDIITPGSSAHQLSDSPETAGDSGQTHGSVEEYMTIGQEVACKVDDTPAVDLICSATIVSVASSGSSDTVDYSGELLDVRQDFTDEQVAAEVGGIDTSVDTGEPPVINSEKVATDMTSEIKTSATNDKQPGSMEVNLNVDIQKRVVECGSVETQPMVNSEKETSEETVTESARTEEDITVDAQTSQENKEAMSTLCPGCSGYSTTSVKLPCTHVVCERCMPLDGGTTALRTCPVCKNRTSMDSLGDMDPAAAAQKDNPEAEEESRVDTCQEWTASDPGSHHEGTVEQSRETEHIETPVTTELKVESTEELASMGSIETQKGAVSQEMENSAVATKKTLLPTPEISMGSDESQKGAVSQEMKDSGGVTKKTLLPTPEVSMGSDESQKGAVSHEMKDSGGATKKTLLATPDVPMASCADVPPPGCESDYNNYWSQQPGAQTGYESGYNSYWSEQQAPPSWGPPSWGPPQGGGGTCPPPPPGWGPPQGGVGTCPPPPPGWRPPQGGVGTGPPPPPGWGPPQGGAGTGPPPPGPPPPYGPPVRPEGPGPMIPGPQGPSGSQPPYGPPPNWYSQSYMPGGPQGWGYPPQQWQQPYWYGNNYNDYYNYYQWYYGYYGQSQQYSAGAWPPNEWSVAASSLAAAAAASPSSTASATTGVTSTKATVTNHPVVSTVGNRPMSSIPLPTVEPAAESVAVTSWPPEPPSQAVAHCVQKPAHVTATAKPTKPLRPVMGPARQIEPPQPVMGPARQIEPPQPVMGPARQREPSQPVILPAKQIEPPKTVMGPARQTEPTQPVRKTAPPSTTLLPALSLLTPTAMLPKAGDSRVEKQKKQLYIFNLPQDTSLAEVKSLVTKFGKVLDCAVADDQGRAGLLAVVTMETVAGATICCTGLRSYRFKGRQLEVQRANMKRSEDGTPPSTSQEEENSSGVTSSSEAKLPVTGVTSSDGSAASMWVGNLPPGTKAKDVLDLLNPHGKVINCKIGASKGKGDLFAMVVMETSSDIVQCINKLHGSEFQGTKLQLKKLKQKSGGTKKPE